MKQLSSLLIYHSNDDFRALLKEMLLKNGHFYLLDTGNKDIFWELQERNKSHFIIVENQLVDSRLTEIFKNRKSFIIIGQSEEKKTHTLSTLFGPSSIMSFPFPSENLAKKVNERS